MAPREKDVLECRQSPWPPPRRSTPHVSWSTGRGSAGPIPSASRWSSSRRSWRWCRRSPPSSATRPPRATPQRCEMEQLTAIVALVPEKHLIIGYKDVEVDEFWVRGHLPDYPLMPGVLICEAAAQLSSYFYGHAIMLTGSTFLGFGGMEDVRFR